MRVVPLLLILSFILVSPVGAEETGTSVRVVVDPRVELMTVVQLLTDYPVLTQHDSPYKRDVKAYFWLAYLEGGQEVGDKELQRQKDRGFRYVEALVERLKEYEASRDRYPTIAEFFPRLVEVFREAAGSGS